jgi:hypothetical protein
VANAPSLTLTAEVPKSLPDAATLFASLATSLQFPEYFGHNWNALDECLTDFHWLSPGAVGIVHGDLPLASQPTDRDLYLEVLSHAEMAWPARGRELVIVFPPEVAPYVRSFW